MKVFIITFLLFGLALFSLPSVKAQDSSPILFWGDGCPHCAKVKEEIKDKKIDEKITIDYREIYYNEENADLFDQKIKECEISPYNAGVPLMYINGTCSIGTDDIIQVLEKEIASHDSSETDNTNDEQTDREISDGNQENDKPSDNPDEGHPITGYVIVSVILVVGVTSYFLWSKRKNKA